MKAGMSHSGNPVESGRSRDALGRRPPYDRPTGEDCKERVSVACDFTTRTCAKCGSAHFRLFGSRGAGVDGRAAVMITCENCMDACILTICKISDSFPMTRDMVPIESAAAR